MIDCIIDYSVYPIAICVTSMWEKYKNIWSFAGDIPNSQLKVSKYIGHIRLFWDINGRSLTFYWDINGRSLMFHRISYRLSLSMYILSELTFLSTIIILPMKSSRGWNHDNPQMLFMRSQLQWTSWTTPFALLNWFVT